MAHFGMNLRVTMDSKQGGRKYMEDVMSVKFEKTDDGRNIEYTYLAVFDGHGGVEAAKFAKEHLLGEITKLKGFWSEDDEEVTQAIREGFLSTHKLMWKAVATWPKTLTGYASTAGTTASVVFIRNGKMYVAHVGDSTVVMGMKQKVAEEDQENEAEEPIALTITDDHKPDDPKELKRIEEGGGKVLAKAGVQRVVWHRPKIANGPVRRSTNVDSIPFLAIARALGDLWSYNAASETFVVSPDPDIATFHIDLKDHKFIILASDGLWNMVKPQEAVDIVNELDPESKDPYEGRKPASILLHMALDRWARRMLRADNTSVIVAYFDPPGISKENLLRQPSDNSIASTLKAASDGDEDDADAETDEIFPANRTWLGANRGGDDEDDFAIDEESHQCVYDNRKPTLKRINPGSFSVLKHSRSSPAAGNFSGKLPKKGKVDAENDPNKVKKRISSGQKRSATDDDLGVPPAKRACLASPESSNVADSPLAGCSSSNRTPLRFTTPLQVDASSSTASPLSAPLNNDVLSPLWPSHLGDDLLLDNASSEPLSVPTSIKPMLCQGSSSSSSPVKGSKSSSSVAPVKGLKSSSLVAPVKGSKDDSSIASRSNGPSPSPLSSQNSAGPGTSSSSGKLMTTPIKRQRSQSVPRSGGSASSLTPSGRKSRSRHKSSPQQAPNSPKKLSTPKRQQASNSPKKLAAVNRLRTPKSAKPSS